MPQRQWTSLSLSEEARFKLDAFAHLICEWNERINLTGFRNLEAIQAKLITPCVLALDSLSLAGKTVLDFGSGAGIPGLVWAACEPQTSITSLEVRAKKAAFQKEVVRTTGIRAEVLCGLFPDAVRDRRFDVVASRAIRFSGDLWAAARHHLEPGGMSVRFAGSYAAEAGWESLPVSDDTSLLVRKAL